MIRGCLVGLIHSTTLIRRDEGSEDGKIVTLMSNDVGALEESAEMFHETWAQVLEVVIGVILLAREVGWVWPLPLCIIASKNIASICIVSFASLLIIHSMFSSEPICCQQPQIQARSLECSNSEPYLCDELRLRFNQDYQDDRLTRCCRKSYTGHTQKGNGGGGVRPLDDVRLRCKW